MDPETSRHSNKDQERLPRQKPTDRTSLGYPSGRSTGPNSIFDHDFSNHLNSINAANKMPFQYHNLPHAGQFFPPPTMTQIQFRSRSSLSGEALPIPAPYDPRYNSFQATQNSAHDSINPGMKRPGILPEEEGEQLDTYTGETKPRSAHRMTFLEQDPASKRVREPNDVHANCGFQLYCRGYNESGTPVPAASCQDRNQMLAQIPYRAIGPGKIKEYQFPSLLDEDKKTEIQELFKELEGAIREESKFAYTQQFMENLLTVVGVLRQWIVQHMPNWLPTFAQPSRLTGIRSVKASSQHIRSLMKRCGRQGEEACFDYAMFLYAVSWAQSQTFQTTNSRKLLFTSICAHVGILEKFAPPPRTDRIAGKPGAVQLVNNALYEAMNSIQKIVGLEAKNKRDHFYPAMNWINGDTYKIPKPREEIIGFNLEYPSLANLPKSPPRFVLMVLRKRSTHVFACDDLVDKRNTSFSASAVDVAGFSSSPPSSTRVSVEVPRRSVASSAANTNSFGGGTVIYGGVPPPQRRHTNDGSSLYPSTPPQDAVPAPTVDVNGGDTTATAAESSFSTTSSPQVTDGFLADDLGDNIRSNDEGVVLQELQQRLRKVDCEDPGLPSRQNCYDATDPSSASLCSHSSSLADAPAASDVVTTTALSAEAVGAVDAAAATNVPAPAASLPTNAPANNAPSKSKPATSGKAPKRRPPKQPAPASKKRAKTKDISLKVASGEGNNSGPAQKYQWIPKAIGSKDVDTGSYLICEKCPADDINSSENIGCYVIEDSSRKNCVCERCYKEYKMQQGCNHNEFISYVLKSEVDTSPEWNMSDTKSKECSCHDEAGNICKGNLDEGIYYCNGCKLHRLCNLHHAKARGSTGRKRTMTTRARESKSQR